MPRPKQRTPELRAHVLQVAVTIVEAEGIAALTARRVADDAGTSLAAVYELFGDKAGVVRAVFFEGFRLLRQRFDALEASRDPRAALVDVLRAVRLFARDHRALGELMFSQPFAAFSPGSHERDAGAATRDFIVGRVRRAVDGGLLRGDATDVAHVLLALVQGLALQESAGWLGSSRASVERRWQLAVASMLAGLAPARARTRTSSARRPRS